MRVAALRVPSAVLVPLSGFLVEEGAQWNCHQRNECEEDAQQCLQGEGNLKCRLLVRVILLNVFVIETDRAQVGQRPEDDQQQTPKAILRSPQEARGETDPGRSSER